MLGSSGGIDTWKQAGFAILQVALIVTSAEILSYKPSIAVGILAAVDLAWSI